MHKPRKKGRRTPEKPENPPVEAAQTAAPAAETEDEAITRRIREQFGEEGAKVVLDFIGMVAERTAERTTQLAFGDEVAKIISRPGLAEHVALTEYLFDFDGAIEPAHVAKMLRGTLKNIRDTGAVSGAAGGLLDPVLSAAERAANQPERAESGFSTPPEQPGVRCDGCGFLHALDSPEYVAIHGPITFGETMTFIDGPHRYCVLRADCLARVLHDRLFEMAKSVLSGKVSPSESEGPPVSARSHRGWGEPMPGAPTNPQSRF